LRFFLLFLPLWSHKYLNIFIQILISHFSSSSNFLILFNSCFYDRIYRFQTLREELFGLNWLIWFWFLPSSHHFVSFSFSYLGIPFVQRFQVSFFRRCRFSKKLGFELWLWCSKSILLSYFYWLSIDCVLFILIVSVVVVKRVHSRFLRWFNVYLKSSRNLNIKSCIWEFSLRIMSLNLFSLFWLKRLNKSFSLLWNNPLSLFLNSEFDVVSHWILTSFWLRIKPPLRINCFFPVCRHVKFWSPRISALRFVAFPPTWIVFDCKSIYFGGHACRPLELIVCI